MTAKLWNKNFYLLWQGQLVSLLGVQANQIAVMFWIKHTTGSATLMGTMMMAAALPAVILEPLGGILADRLSRKKIIVWCDFASGVLICAVAALMLTRPAATDLILVTLFVVTTLVGVLQAFFRPAITASIPDIVPESKLAAANSLNQSSFELSALIGSGLGGILFRLLGAPILLLADGISYLFSAATQTFVTIPQQVKKNDGEAVGAFAGIWRSLAEGFAYFWQQKGMRTFFLMFAFHSFFLVPCLVMLPFYVEDYLKVSTDWYGYLLAAHGVGALIGYSAAGTIALQGRARSRVMLCAYFVSSSLIGGLGLTASVAVAIGLVATIGVLNGYIHVNFVTIVQARTPAELRGRLFGIVAMVSTGLSPFAMGLTGIVADLLNKDVALLYRLCGFSLTAVIVIFSTAKPLRDFLAGIDLEAGSMGLSGAKTA